MYIPEYFKASELVPKMIYDIFGDDSFYFLDEKILRIADRIRDHFGAPMMVNNYAKGLHNRGYRLPLSNVGSPLSTHKTGRALDFNIDGLSAEDVYMDIITHEKEFFDMGIRRVEKLEHTPTWTHIDIKETNKDIIYYFDI